MDHDNSGVGLDGLLAFIDEESRALGFDSFGVAAIDIEEAGEHLREWLARGYHGSMEWMASHGARRYRPGELVPGTVSCLSFTLDYLPEPMPRMSRTLGEGGRGYIARYALGRDYHKYLRRRLAKLAGRIAQRIGPFGYRVFTDSAPVMEKPLAANAGLGWIGKHTNLIDRERGSWFFIGEIYTNLPLPAGRPTANHCGACARCISACPTGAIVAPYQLDARRCISYLTIENKGDIPEALRAMIGNRIFGCDDCQIVCPWNRFARVTAHDAFRPRQGLEGPDLAALLLWSEAEYLARTEGSALRRIGYEGWLRNVAVALGNAPTRPAVVNALDRCRKHPSAMVRRHVAWARSRHVVD